MSELFSYYDGELKDFIAESLTTKDALLKSVISGVSEKLVKDLKVRGVLIDESWCHTLDNNAVRHTLRVHGAKSEIKRGQIPIKDEDLLSIPLIVSSYDFLSTGKNKRGQDVVIYTKEMDNGITIYVEEVRLGRHELATTTMYKKKKENSPTLIDQATQISDLSSSMQI